MPDRSDWIALRDEAAAKGLLRVSGSGYETFWGRDMPEGSLTYVAQAVTGISRDAIIRSANRCYLISVSSTYFPALVGLQSGQTMSHEEWMAAHRFWLERAAAVWVIHGPNDAYLRSRGCYEEAQFAVANERLLFLPEIGDA